MRAGPETCTLRSMQRTLASILALATAGGAVLLYACSSTPTTPPQDSGPTDTGVDAPVAFTGTCVQSPAPAPFPSGACNSPKPAQPDSFDEAIAKRGFDRCSLKLDPKKMPYAVMDVTDKRQLPDFTPLLSYPLRLPAYGRETAKWLDAALMGDRPVSGAIASMSARRGSPVTECAPPEWFAVQKADPAPLATALGLVAADFGADFDADATKQSVADVPLELQQALAPVVRALGHAWLAVDAAKQAFAPQLVKLQSAPWWVLGTFKYTWTPEQFAAFDGFDVAAITTAAVELATAVEAANLSRFKNADVPAVDLTTPFGAIVLRGAGADAYDPGSAAETAAFVLDTGGSDTYRVPVAAATPTRPIAIAVDLGGDDAYAYVEKKVPDDAIGHRLPSDGAGRSGRTLSRVGRQGSALLGVGLLWDLGGGKDKYQSLTFSQGAGVFGVGVLYDDGGDDTYLSEALSQGMASFGVGLLLDGGGKDSYLTYTMGQGYGFTKGVGALADLSGDDTYYSDPGHPDVMGDVLYANGQLPGKANTSLTQGCGFGHRPDSPEPPYQFAGGMGILRDAAGKDSYQTGVFGQGCAFGMGMGFLLEGGGDDTYEGLWYVQGANAHTGVALFLEQGGNDKYNPTFPIAATSIGVGHDYSAAVHLDEGGDDVYRAPGLALGCGNANGMGVMVVAGGTDTFTTPSVNSLGCANSTEVFQTPRAGIPTIGVFVKAGGTGAYTVSGIDAGALYPNGEWSYAPNNTPDGGADGGPVYDYEKSIGIDRPNGSASLP